MSAAPRYTQRQLEDAIRCEPNVNSIARRLGVTRDAVYRRLRRDPAARALLAAERARCTFHGRGGWVRCAS